MNIQFLSSHFRAQYKTFCVFFISIFIISGCSPGGDNSSDISDSIVSDDSNISLRIAAPTEFDAPFCTRVQVSSTAFSPIIVDQTLPAGTPFIDTVIPNIPEGDGIRVEVGIFANGTCAAPLGGDWYGFASNVSVVDKEVTLVSISLSQQNAAPGTGTIIIRDDGTVISQRLLHGEVVSANNTPIPGAICRIFENNTQIGSVVAGSMTVDLGVLNTPVDTGLKSSEVDLNCFSPGFSNTQETALLMLDPNNPQFGTFTATVVMQRGISTEIIRSEATGLSARLHVPKFQLSRVNTEAGAFDKIDNFDNAFALAGGGDDNLSFPEVPMHTLYFAVPNGEEVESIKISAGQDGETMFARLYPIQPPHNDRAGPEGEPTPEPEEPFVFDLKQYLAGATRIDQHTSESDVSSEDGVTIYQLRTSLVDYDSRSELLTRYPTLNVDIQFTSSQNQSCFRTFKVASGFNQDGVDEMLEDQGFMLSKHVINRELFKVFPCFFEFKPIFFGARLVIVSDPSFLTAANNLKQHKVSRGLSTVVVSTDSLTTGTLTATNIKAYLANAYANWFIKPKWLLLMGDSEFIPTYYDQQNSWDTAKNAGDIYYGQLNGNILSMPVLGIGRFPVDTQDQAQSIVDKVIAYENSPPTGPNFFSDNTYYSKVAFAAEFQDNGQGACCTALDGRAERWFAETSEKIRNYLVPRSIDVERIYTTSPSNAQPTLYRDGNAVPLNLRKPTFPWDGDRFDVIDAMNDGRSILYHRDHGWWTGWGTPSFNRNDLDSISVSGNEFPVVYSINCASGIFDNETVDLAGNIVGGGYGPGISSVYWAEKFLRKSDGAIAVIGDTRSSSTVLNNDFAQGLFDATWPGHLGYGNNTVIRKVGDILNHAKGYILSLGHSNTAKRQENVIYNVLGDPTVELRTRPPKSISITTVFVEQRFLELGIRCLSCPSVMEPLILVAQDLQGNEVARGLASYNGKEFNAQIGIGEFDGELVITASGYEVNTSQINFKQGGQEGPF